jgi:hypothetical protein
MYSKLFRLLTVFSAPQKRHYVDNNPLSTKVEINHCFFILDPYFVKWK